MLLAVHSYQFCRLKSKAVALKPDFAEAYSNRGLVRQDCHLLDAALADFSHDAARCELTTNCDHHPASDVAIPSAAAGFAVFANGLS